MAEVTVSPVWDGDPDAPDSTAEVTAIRLFFPEEERSGEEPIELTLGLEIAVDVPTARQLWGRLGDVLRAAAGEG